MSMVTKSQATATVGPAVAVVGVQCPTMRCRCQRNSVSGMTSLVNGGREPPPPALLEPYVTVSRHTAPTVRRGVEATRCQ